VPGAVSVDWRIGVEGGRRSGRLGDVAAAAKAFGDLGVTESRPVLVVGDWTAGWGEEGRIAWDLEYLGHPAVQVLEGGISAWPGPRVSGASAPIPSVFTAAPREQLRADRSEVRAAPVVVDVREPDEYHGSNWFLAAYGGHVPGAVNAPWRSIVDGTVALPADRPVVVYCTGGVRSALAWLWLSNHGVEVMNYDGSWWDWAEHEPPPISGPAR
jgi:thiosulfate/3-mercaptopyruvate sulfurtransferase